MNTEINERELLARMADLPRAIAPEHDVWPKVQSRIENESTVVAGQGAVSRWRNLAVAAGVMVAFATGVFLGPKWLATPVDRSSAPELAGNDSGVGHYPPDLSATLAATELEYQAAFREFVSVGDSKSSLSPVTVDKLLMSWDEMKQSEAGLTAALKDNPDNPFLNTRMMELRSRQLRFLKQIAVLDHNSRRITT